MKSPHRPAGFLFWLYLFEKPKNTDYFSKNSDFFHYDRIHKVILRLKPENTFLFVESLHSRAVLDHCYHHISI